MGERIRTSSESAPKVKARSRAWRNPNDCLTEEANTCAAGVGRRITSRRLEPGSYTAIVTGANETTGIALIEIYEMERG
jgi:hypothetical protein